MPTIQASLIISRVRTVLQDPSAVRWTDTELLGWINDGQRAIASVRADASTKYATAVLVAGTLQALPADAIMLIDIPRNKGTNGTTPGVPIRKVERTFLDENIPTWHTDAATSAIRHFAYDPKSLRNFWVYPPSDGTGYVELLYSFSPVDLATTSAVIGVDDIYTNALIYFTLFSAFAKNADDPADMQRSASMRSAFEGELTSKAQTDATNERDPKDV